ncbi:MAG: helix-turn-helix domain-containing protein [Candidatus Eremiobacteraeota bacterium]|nr:helix-turn-helix domain-containing protein [Candidatus Eremiobacteraeota bacterium]
MPALGEDLRAAREARNLSLSDVSERIHIRSVYLQSLEDEDWGAIAAPVYVRGFLRTYARFLGLDPEDAVQRFNAALPEGPSAQDGYAEPDRERTGPSIWLWLATAAAIILVGFVGYNYYELQREQPATPAVVETPQPTVRSPADARSPRPNAANAAAIASGTGGANTVLVHVVQRSWLRIAVDGKVPMEGIFPAGTERTFHGKSATVRAGNAAGVDVTVNGHDVGTLGPPGNVVERTFTLAQE